MVASKKTLHRVAAEPSCWVQAVDRLQFLVEFGVTGAAAHRAHEKGFAGYGEEFLGAGKGVGVEGRRTAAAAGGAQPSLLGRQQFLPVAVAVAQRQQAGAGGQAALRIDLVGELMHHHVAAAAGTVDELANAVPG